MSILDRLREGIVARSVEETQRVAGELAEILPSEAVLNLKGDLGSGKTTFVKGLAFAWNIQEVVTSPTFNIYKVYKGDRELVHMDAYRLNPRHDLFDELMIEDFMEKPYCLAIEWPQNLCPLPWPVFAELRFEILKDNERRIQI